MATYARTRSGARSRVGRSSYSYGQSGYGNWGSAGASIVGRSPYGSTGLSQVPAQWKTCGTSFWNKLNSFKVLFNQVKGPAKHGRPSPTTLNTFANWINKGANIQTVSAAQVARWAKTAHKTFNTRTPSPTACKNVLSAKFGKSAIKAVCRSKTGAFLVATAPQVNGKPFCFPK